jgi:hypothetical protein
VPLSIIFSVAAAAQLRQLEKDRGLGKRLKAVRKTIGRLEVDPRHPALQSHQFVSLSGPNGEEAFVSYAEQDTPAAYRVIWCYGPTRGQITVIAITKHL